MADFIKNNADLIKSVLALVVAIIPLVIAIISLRREPSLRGVEAIDSSLKILRVTRRPIDKISLKKVKRTFQIIYYVNLCILSLFYIGILWILAGNTIYFAFFVATLYIILFIINFTSKLRLFSTDYTLENPTARYYFFEKADVVIEANHHYLFAKILNALRAMKYQILEASEEDKNLEAFRKTFGGFAKRGYVSFLFNPLDSIQSAVIVIEVGIEKIESLNNVYKVKLGFDKDLSIPLRSKITNRFIDLLISKPKNGNDDTIDKIEVADDLAD